MTILDKLVQMIADRLARATDAELAELTKLYVLGKYDAVINLTNMARGEQERRRAGAEYHL